MQDPLTPSEIDRPQPITCWNEDINRTRAPRFFDIAGSPVVTISGLPSVTSWSYAPAWPSHIVVKPRHARLMRRSFGRQVHVIGHGILSSQELLKGCVASQLCALSISQFPRLSSALRLSHFPFLAQPSLLCICISPTIDADTSHFSAIQPSTTQHQWAHARQPQPGTHPIPSCAICSFNPCDWKR